MTKKTGYSPEVRARAVRMVLEHQGEHASQWAAIGSIAAKIGCTAETLRGWVRQAERDQGLRAGTTSESATGSRRWSGRSASCGRRTRSSQGVRVFCDGGARPPIQVMKSFIDEHRDAYGVEPICRVLPIAPSTYREHAARRKDPARAPARERRDAVLRKRSAGSGRRISRSTASARSGGSSHEKIRCGALHRRTAHAADGDQRRRPRQIQDHGQRSIGAMSA